MRYALLLILALAACKGDREKCEKAARNFFELRMPGRIEADIAHVPEAERDLARSKRRSELTNVLEEEIEFTVQQCVSANNEKTVDCLIAAKTEKEALACADPATGK